MSSAPSFGAPGGHIFDVVAQVGWGHRKVFRPQVLEHTKLTSNVVVLWFTSYLFGVPNNQRFMNNIMY